MKPIVNLHMLLILGRIPKAVTTGPREGTRNLINKCLNIPSDNLWSTLQGVVRIMSIVHPDGVYMCVTYLSSFIMKLHILMFVAIWTKQRQFVC